MDEAKEKFYGCHDDTKSAFDELCAMVDALNVSFQIGLNFKVAFLFRPTHSTPEWKETKNDLSGCS